jgi:hypothetical protein
MSVHPFRSNSGRGGVPGAPTSRLFGEKGDFYLPPRQESKHKQKSPLLAKTASNGAAENLL